MIAAASKYVDAPAIIEAYDAGIRVFGENKVRDLKAKYEFISSARPEILSELKFHTPKIDCANRLRTLYVEYVAPTVKRCVPKRAVRKKFLTHGRSHRDQNIRRGNQNRHRN